MGDDNCEGAENVYKKKKEIFRFHIVKLCPFPCLSAAQSNLDRYRAHSK